ncbi:hypothetical protein [Mycobacterium nebraskense]|nr:hypothetical protein [Mycobacterium nebraskense]
MFNRRMPVLQYGVAVAEAAQAAPRVSGRSLAATPAATRAGG